MIKVGKMPCLEIHTPPVIHQKEAASWKGNSPLWVLSLGKLLT